MVDDRRPGNGPDGGFALERVVRDDGRYLLYYSWPTPTDGSGVDDAAPAGEASASSVHRAPSVARGGPEAPQHPWSPESGPPDRDDGAAPGREDGDV